MNYWVYVHTCPNGKRYVGCTKQARPELRWAKGNKYRYNKHFYSAIQKYGWSSIKHEAWELTCESEMYYAEKYLIAYYNTTDNKFGYNHSTGGERSSLGYRHSEEARRKISEATKKKWADPKYKKRVSETLKSRFLSEEVRKKRSEIRKGIHLSEETKRKMSEACKNRPRIKIKLPDGTVLERTKQNLVKNFINRGKEFEYVS